MLITAPIISMPMPADKPTPTAMNMNRESAVLLYNIQTEKQAQIASLVVHCEKHSLFEAHNRLMQAHI